jgi:hypothetical protein
MTLNVSYTRGLGGYSFSTAEIAMLKTVSDQFIANDLPLRIEFPGGLFHATSRGDRREDIYLDDEDRAQWLALLGEVCKRFNWRCHAYCLMDNKVNACGERKSK